MVAIAIVVSIVFFFFFRREASLDIPSSGHRRLY